MSDKGLVVVLDDEPNMGKVLRKLLGLEGYRVESFTEPGPFIAYIQGNPVDVVLTDLRMPGLDGEGVLAKLSAEKAFRGEAIVMTGYGTVESAMRCVRQGAFDYVTKPFDTKALLATVAAAAASARRRAPGSHGRPAVADAEATAPAAAAAPPTSPASQWELVGTSPQLEAARQLIARIAPTESAVLISGESGTGKELAARAIHRLSRRCDNRFVAINCASIPETLIESELFGHVKGSFTGAHETKMGLVEAADGGTLFLDEIGELPLALQSKLLRVLQEREITRVGDVETRPVDIRVIAATNRRLEKQVELGHFRQDLYYRLNVLKIRMPALRERPGDIPVLARHFLATMRDRAGRPAATFEEELLEHIARMSWPGNVRELRNFVERVLVLSSADAIGPAVLQELALYDSRTLGEEEKPAASGSVVPASTPPPPAPAPIDFRQARDDFERDYVARVLRSVGGNVTEAARVSGMSRRHFYEKIEKLKIDLDAFK